MSVDSAMEKGEIGATSQSQVLVDPGFANGQPATMPTRELSLPPFSSTSTRTLLGSPSINDPDVSKGNEKSKPKLKFKWLRRRKNQGIVLASQVRSLRDSPKGYPSVATFLDSDENFMVYRRFGFVQARLLLEKQDDLRNLESKLDRYDRRLGLNPQTKDTLRTRDLKLDAAIARKELMDKLEKCFNEYAALMASAQQFVSMNRPSSFDYTSVARYLYDKNPLRQEEQAWIQHREDLVTLRPGREHAWLDAAIERILKRLRFLQPLFCSKDTNRKTDGTAMYFTKSRVDILASTIIAIMILVLLVVPIYILYHLISSKGTGKTDSLCIGTLLVFTLAFSAAISLFTRAKRHEALAAAAAYCAVLVVFLGNVGNRKN